MTLPLICFPVLFPKGKELLTCRMLLCFISVGDNCNVFDDLDIFTFMEVLSVFRYADSVFHDPEGRKNSESIRTIIKLSNSIVPFR